MLKAVITSWQVIAVTIFLVFYLRLVFYVARRYHRPMQIKNKFKIKLKRKAKPEAAIGVPEQEDIGVGTSDELGLEEE